MYKKMVLSTKATASKTKKPKILNKETENRQHGPINSSHKWGEDYYGAGDYYEKSVNSIPKKINYSAFKKKADKQ